MKKIVFLLLMVLLFSLLVGCNDSNLETEVETYRVKFYVDEELYESVKYEAGEKLVYPEEPFKDLYDFIGWYNEEDELVREGFEVTEKLNLYAKFDPIEQGSSIADYKVNYYVNGTLFDYQQYYAGEFIETYPIPYDYIPTGMHFVGWFDKDNLELEVGKEVTRNIDYYARFEESGVPETPTPINYYINFYVDGERYTGGWYSEGFELEFFAVELGGYEFLFWEDSETGTYYYPGETIVVGRDMSLYAIFSEVVEPTPVPEEYEVVYYVNNEYYGTYYYQEPQTVFLPLPEIEEHYFIVWQEIGTDYIFYEDKGVYVNKDMEINAKYDPYTYGISFFAMDITFKRVYGVKGDICVVPQIELEGYEFKYWIDFETGDIYYPGDEIEIYNNMQFQGVYTKIERDPNVYHNVSFYTNGEYYYDYDYAETNAVFFPNKQITGLEILYWENGNTKERYEPDDFTYVVEDTVFYGIYGEEEYDAPGLEPKTYTVSLYINLELTETFEVAEGEIIKLEDIEIEGQYLLHWFEPFYGNYYYAGDEVAIERDCKFYATTAKTDIN